MSSARVLVRRKLMSAAAVVEADSFAQQMLWERWNERIEWESESLGHGLHIGKVDDRPVYVSFSYAKIKGETVVFWYATSQVVDYKMIEDWIKPKTHSYSTSTDAMNFGNAIIHIDRMIEKRSN
jgi:hypothetical protein